MVAYATSFCLFQQNFCVLVFCHIKNIIVFIQVVCFAFDLLSDFVIQFLPGPHLFCKSVLFQVFLKLRFLPGQCASKLAERKQVNATQKAICSLWYLEAFASLLLCTAGLYCKHFIIRWALFLLQNGGSNVVKVVHPGKKIFLESS